MESSTGRNGWATPSWHSRQTSWIRSNVFAIKPRRRGRSGRNSEQRVTTERQGVVIEPSNPAFIYPPVYNPSVCGPWPYPDYPPLDISSPDYGIGFAPPFGPC